MTTKAKIALNALVWVLTEWELSSQFALCVPNPRQHGNGRQDHCENVVNELI